MRRRLAVDEPSFIKPDENLVELVWGGSYIERMKGLPPSGRRIGESWECSSHPGHPSLIRSQDGSTVALNDYLKGKGTYILGREIAQDYGDELPILVKFIDAREDLSVQVHPSDEQAVELGEADRGKDEAWLILEAEQDAVIHLGFAERVDRQQFETDLNSPDIDIARKYLRAVPVTGGDVFMVPAGTIHSIGKGIVLLEIEQASSITYRVWDWNREPKRPLHVDQAMRVLDLEPRSADTFRRHPRTLGHGEDTLVDGFHFSLRRLTMEAGTERQEDTGGGFQILTCIEGEVIVEKGGAAERLGRGQSLIVSAGIGTYLMNTGEGAIILKSML